MSSRSDRVWAAWLCAVLASLLAFEIPALLRRDPGKPSGTLTHWFQGLLGTRRHDKRWRRWVLAPSFAAFCAWLAAHMTVDGWRKP